MNMHFKYTQILFFLVIFGAETSFSQNDLSLQLNDGDTFRVLAGENYLCEEPEALVTLRDLKTDTVYLKIELADGNRYGITVFLLEKGKKTSGKVFSYVLKKKKQKLRPVFMGMYIAD